MNTEAAEPNSSRRPDYAKENLASDIEPVPPFVELQRAKFILLAMAAIVVFISLWEVGNRNFSRGWDDWPMQLFRLVAPLTLIYVIWTGRSWARYVLAGTYVFMLYINCSTIMYIPRMLRAGNWGDFVLALSLLVGCPVMIALSLSSPAIKRLIKHRHRERRARQVGV